MVAITVCVVIRWRGTGKDVLRTRQCNCD